MTDVLSLKTEINHDNKVQVGVVQIFPNIIIIKLLINVFVLP